MGVLLALLAVPVTAPAWECEARVERVIDADTLALRCAERRFRLRLQGVDAPELAQPFGTEARDALARQVGGRSLQVESRGTDAYERVIGRVRLDGAPLEAWLVGEGWAWCPRRATAACHEHQEQARSARRGLWAAAETPVPPWTWRHLHPREDGALSAKR